MFSRIKGLHLGLFAVAIGATAMPALAGEITGNGRLKDMNSRSICAFSGQNDTPEGYPPEGDPGGRVQSYGYFQGYWDLWDSNDLDPHTDFLKPGFACNPNRGPDLNAE